MNMSKSVRRQLIGCDMVTSVIDACKQSYKDAGVPIPIKISAALWRMRGYALTASGMALNGRVNSQGQYELDAKATRQYERALLPIQAEIVRQYGERVDARDYVATVLTVVEDVRTQIPKGYRAEETWFKIAATLASVLAHYDEDESHVDRGVERAEQFKLAAGW